MKSKCLAVGWSVKLAGWLGITIIFSLSCSWEDTNSQSTTSIKYSFKMPEYEPLEATFSSEGGWFVNRLRGYMAWVFPDIKVVMLPQGFYVVDLDETVFGRITFIPAHRDSVKAIWRDIASKLQPYVKGDVFFNKRDSGKMTVYHWLINGARFPSVFFPKVQKSGTYEVNVIIKSFNNWHRVEILTYKPSVSETKKKEIWKTVQSLRVLPANERVSYSVQGVPSGVNAYIVPVPENFYADGFVFQMGTLQEVSWEVKHATDQNVFIRRDVFNISAGSTMGVPVYAATLNGNPLTGYQMPIVMDRSQFIETINILWGGGWQLVKVWEEPIKAVKRQLKEQIYGQIYQSYGFYPSQIFTDAFVALFKKGNLYRYAVLTSVSVVYADWTTSSGGTYATLVTMQVPADKHKDMSHLLASILIDAMVNPQWVVAVRRENVQKQSILNRWTAQRIEAIRREGQMFRDYLNAREQEAQMYQDALYSHQEFTSDVNEAWGNILGEKIYAQDPTTGEIFYLDDVGGNYLRSPETGNIITGLSDYDASYLQSLGWQRMNLSYEPFK